MPDTMTETIADRAARLAPGFYVERDGGRWYIVTPDHGSRIGEEFKRNDDAQQMLCWLAGDPQPAGWVVTTCGERGRHHDLQIGDNHADTTLWGDEIREHFPNNQVLPALPAVIAADGVADKYIVINENTLCHRVAGSDFVGVLAGKPQHGGRDWKNGPILIDASDNVRAATLRDFHYFRVSPNGHVAGA